LKAEQREAWRLLGDRLALLHSADAHENTEHPAVVNSGTAQPAAEPQAPWPPLFGGEGRSGGVRAGTEGTELEQSHGATPPELAEAVWRPRILARRSPARRLLRSLQAA